MSKLYFLCGLVASGKSTWAEFNKEKLDFVIHSSDSIRAELGDINDQSKNELVFNTLHKRVKKDLLSGKNVCVDATSLSRRKRVHFLNNELKNIPCEKICVLFATPIEICKRNNANRDRKVPEEVIERMVRNYDVPCMQEGWNDIQIVWWDWKKDGLEFNFNKDMKDWRHVSHDNPHHKLNIGDHMMKAVEYMFNEVDNPVLLIATCMHDCGKIATKDFHNSKGESCETAHYYQHHLYGSYLSLFYLKELRDNEYVKMSDKAILYISLLIGLHMNPFLKWKNSKKAEEKDRRMFGENVYRDIIKLHEADLAAH